MSLNVSLLNGITVDAFHVGAVVAVNDLGGGNYSIDASEFNGSFFDFWTGTVGAPVSTDVTTVALSTYNVSQNIIEYELGYADGTTVPPFGGVVLAYNQNQVLVDQIDGFVPTGNGNYVGTPDPNHYEIFSAIDLSQYEPGYAGPTLPLVFGQTGPFGGLSPVPEPSSALIIVAAVAAFLVTRLLGFGRSASRRLAA